MWRLLLGTALGGSGFGGTTAHSDTWEPEAPRADDEVPAPIFFGDVEDDFPAAVGLGAYGFTVCSGSLITPRLVLTAGHCGSDIDLEVVVAFGEAFFGTLATEPDHVRSFADMVVHPDYVPLVSSPLGGTLGEFDVAVLELAEDAPVDPIWFRTESLKPRAAEGSEVVSVGFGLTDTSTFTGGEKHSAALIVDELDPMFLVSNSATNDEGANICSGDSGGPQYHQEEDGTWLQWAVHSWGDTSCLVQSGSTRTDVVGEWILDQVEAVHGSRDRCEVNGHYGDGVCDRFCDDFDPDCEVVPFEDAVAAATAAGELRAGGCNSAPIGGFTGAAVVLLALARRRPSPVRTTMTR